LLSVTLQFSSATMRFQSSSGSLGIRPKFEVPKKPRRDTNGDCYPEARDECEAGIPDQETRTQAKIES
jgi:hypothetical protein